MAKDVRAELGRQRRLCAEDRPQAHHGGRSDVTFPSSGVIAIVVLREINVVDGVMKVQRVRYADSPPVVGQYETYGEPFRAYPLTTATYSSYEIWEWPEIDANGDPNPISTLTVPLLAINERGHWLLTLPFKALASLLDPTELANACSFG